MAQKKQTAKKQFWETITVPQKGRGKKPVLDELKSFKEKDPDYKHLKTWSLVYYLGEEHTEFMHRVYGEYFSANGLNPMAFQSLKRFETEVIQMTANLHHGGENAAGVMTSGGTESCLLAVKTYRDHGRNVKGIKRPNMVIPKTAHVAWEKGGEYFGVQIIRAPLGKDYRVDPKAVKKMVNKNTVMILGSAPEYPHGLIDPIEKLGETALAKKIPLHVDACVGGYILPFQEKLGHDIPLWDYRVPGVTSISADTHKYGYSAKGTSTITYRDIDYLTHQFFVYENWPGGVFASPALLGTRPGGAYAAAWAALQSIGEDGYMEITKKTMDTVEKLIRGIEDIPELEIIGSPKSSLFAYKSKDKDVNIYAVGDVMEEKGWHIDRLQFPEALHAMVTALHADVVKKYIDDLKKSVARVKAHPELAESGGAAMYGMIASIPLRGMVRKNVLKMFARMYGPDAKMIDPGNVELEGEGKEQGPGDFAEKAAMWYIKMKRRFSK